MDVKGHDFFLNDGEEGTENEGFGNPLTLDSAGFFWGFFFQLLDFFFPSWGRISFAFQSMLFRFLNSLT